MKKGFMQLLSVPEYLEEEGEDEDELEDKKLTGTVVYFKWLLFLESGSSVHWLHLKPQLYES